VRRTIDDAGRELAPILAARLTSRCAP
jgi:hypothetical protein